MADTKPPGPAGTPAMRFRFQRGTLSESMETERTFRSRAEFVRTLREHAGLWAAPSDQEFVENLDFVLYADGPDNRIGWERTYLVTLSGSPIGFSDCVPGDLPDAPAPAAPEASAPPEVPFIASRPELGALREDLVAALATEMPARLARDAVYGPAEHPAPWRWEEWECNRDGRVVDEPWAHPPAPDRQVKVWNLRDASGGLLLTTQDDVPPASPRVRELLRAAPELEGLLRERKPVCEEVESAAEEFIASRHWRPGRLPPEHPTCGKCWACRVRALLAALDRAGK